MKIRDKRPTLFEKSACGIWLDPHIQQEMLRAHLNPASDAASRKPEAIRLTCDWLDRQLAPGSRVLDLGCGPGLYAAQLAARGHRMTGIDLNGHAIEYAAKHHPTITFMTGDYLTDFPPGEYDAIILIYCDFCTHSDREREILLRYCRRALAPGGKLIFDFFTESRREESKSWEYCPNGGFWAAEEYLLLSQTFHYPEHGTWASQYNLLSKGETRHFIVWERCFECDEIKMLLNADGFDKITFTPDLLPANDFTASHEMFVTAEVDNGSNQ